MHMVEKMTTKVSADVKKINKLQPFLLMNALVQGNAFISKNDGLRDC
jgi:hypothetical protein